MKRLFTVIFCLCLLSACGAKETGAPQSSADTSAPAEASAPKERSMEPGTGLSLDLERAVYDPSLTQYTYFIGNATEETADFGEDYAIQRQTNGQWRDLTMVENAAFTAIGYELEPGETMALTCGFGIYQEPPEPGTYRLVKNIGGQTLCAEFQIGDSPYTANTPYGFAPLESLSQDYGADSAGTTDVVFTQDGMVNREAVEVFLDKVGLGVSCQLRVVQDYDENTPMVTDAIHENGHFLWRMRQGGELYEQRFSYLVTDGENLYLSNGADWDAGERYGDRRTLLIPEGAGSWMIEEVERQTARRLESNVTRYKIWSSDGIRDACLTDAPTEFAVGWQKPGEGSHGQIYDLNHWDGLESAIVGVKWEEDGSLKLTCKAGESGTSTLYFDPETGELTSELCSLPWAKG